MKSVERVEDMITKIMRYLSLVGIALILTVYSRRRLRQISVSIYFQSMAIMCFCSTLDSLIMADYFFPIYKASWHFGKFLSFLPILLVPFSEWLEVLAGLDRFLTIVFPHKYKFIRKKYIQLVFIVIVFKTNALLYSYYSFISIYYLVFDTLQKVI